jgi:hypothetical protein
MTKDRNKQLKGPGEMTPEEARAAHLLKMGGDVRALPSITGIMNEVVRQVCILPPSAEHTLKTIPPLPHLPQEGPLHHGFIPDWRSPK